MKDSKTKMIYLAVAIGLGLIAVWYWYTYMMRKPVTVKGAPATTLPTGKIDTGVDVLNEKDTPPDNAKANPVLVPLIKWLNKDYVRLNVMIPDADDADIHALTLRNSLKTTDAAYTPAAVLYADEIKQLDALGTDAAKQTERDVILEKIVYSAAVAEALSKAIGWRTINTTSAQKIVDWDAAQTSSNPATLARVWELILSDTTTYRRYA